MAGLKTQIIELEELNNLYNDYLFLGDFIRNHNNINYIQFDYFTVNDLTLFNIDSDFDFKLIENIIENVNKAMPSIKKIFAKPLLHLIDQDIILPVEAVKIVNKDTIQHVINHSNMWENVTKDGIKPAKLMTKNYIDNYQIYENIIFCNTIDEILLFTRRNIRLLKNLIYTNSSINLNFLERTNHLNYFLALGKLHTGYIRLVDKYYDIAKKDLNKLNFINSQISSKLNYPIYKKNKKRSRNLKLRKTNILSMHKDYKKIYNLNLLLQNKKIKKKYMLLTNTKISELMNNYSNYCQILLIFSVGHFNFSMNEKDIIDYNNLNINFKFKEWQLNINTLIVNKIKIIKMSINNYSFVFIPIVAKPKNNEYRNIIKNVSDKVEANEFIICNPYQEDEYKPDECHISRSSIDSFRRFQQIILRGMVLSDNKRADCPFCSNGLELNHELSIDNDKVYECSTCRTMIYDTYCKETGQSYSYTHISNLESNPLSSDDFYDSDEYIYNQRLESQLFYRNITQIDEDMNVICPHCKKIH